MVNNLERELEPLCDTSEQFSAGFQLHFKNRKKGKAEHHHVMSQKGQIEDHDIACHRLRK